MATQDVTLLLAMLAVVAEATVAAAAIVVVGARRSALLARLKSALAGMVGSVGIELALGVAVISTLGSLYFSEVAKFVPCRLCWYQRIAMYPLVPVLVVAIRRHDSGGRFYALPVAAVGGLISTYHVFVEHVPTLEGGVCEPANPCTLIWVRRFGYLTIPTMALSAFALIVVLLLASGAEGGAEEGAQESSDAAEELEAA